MKIRNRILPGIQILEIRSFQRRRNIEKRRKGRCCCSEDVLSIHSAMRTFFYSSRSSNHPGSTSAVQHPSPKQQRRPSPFFLFVSSSMGPFNCKMTNLLLLSCDVVVNPPSRSQVVPGNKLHLKGKWCLSLSLSLCEAAQTSLTLTNRENLQIYIPGE